MAEAESISARKATLLNPTEDDETAQVLRRRLFSKIDDSKAAVAIKAYRALWKQNEAVLSQDARRPETVELFKASYTFASAQDTPFSPLHLCVFPGCHC